MIPEFKKMNVFFACSVLVIWWSVINISYSETNRQQTTTETIKLENDSLRVEVEAKSGCFTVTEKVTGQVWKPDPWEHAAALLTFNEFYERINLSKSQKVQVEKSGANEITIAFEDPILANGQTVSGVKILVKLNLKRNRAILEARVVKAIAPANFKLKELRFPARHFSLRTDKDRGAGVIPYWQGVICPSYIFPMTGGRFCMWDDIQQGGRSTGILKMYAWQYGLSMPWFGTYTEKSAVVGILAKEPAADLEYIINNNAQPFFSRRGEMSPYPRIVTLTPVWNLQSENDDRIIQYHFLPHGNYVQMAKRYRQIAKERGYFISLKEKTTKNPNVKKIAGAIYLGLYGGYPHYVNMPGMAFTFDQLKDIIQDMHDNLNIKDAFIHAWGTFSNYVPNNWPISAELGGVAKLREAVSLAKGYGYLYSSYHAYSPALENDPDFSTDLFPKRVDGSFIIKGRWNRVDPKYFLELAQKSLPKEIAVIGPNADITDIAYTSPPDPGGYKIELAKYLHTLGLVMGTERGQEQYIPYFDLFEGMTYYPRLSPLATFSHYAPLFNLVYHDAIAVYGKIQDPDNDVTFRGDFRIKTLRNILFGNGTLIFFAPYEYSGMRDMIQMANQLVSPVHKDTFFEELVDHEFLSPDFKVQRSRFSNGVRVTVNLGPVEQNLPNGISIPGYGYRILSADSKLKTGYFETILKTQ